MTSYLIPLCATCNESHPFDQCTQIVHVAPVSHLEAILVVGSSLQMAGLVFKQRLSDSPTAPTSNSRENLLCQREAAKGFL